MNEIAVYPHKTCIFALEKSCLTSKANLCIRQNLPNFLKKNNAIIRYHRSL